MAGTDAYSAAGAGGCDPISAPQLTIAWQCASLLLGYPTQPLIERLEVIHRVSHHLPDSVGGPLRSTVVHLEAEPLTRLQDEYRDTFDELQMRTVLPPSASRDEICAVLQYAGAIDRETGRQLLLEHRAALEGLRISLAHLRSEWVGAVIAVLNTLPSGPSSASVT